MRLFFNPNYHRWAFFAVAVGLYFLVALLSERELMLSAKQLYDAALGSLLAGLVVFVGLPSLFYRGRYWAFFLFCVAGFIGFATIDELLLDRLVWASDDPRYEMSFRGLRFGVLNAAIASFSIAAMVALYDNLESRRKLAALAELKNHAELSALKSQLNPHLLLNTLNNVYGLALEHDERTPDTVLKLASILRYALYETDESLAALDREIEILQAYIALQEIGIGERADIEFDVEGEPHGRHIAPLLLLPLVENAFKHGAAVVDTAPSKIRLQLRLLSNAIEFTAENPFDPGVNISEQGSGIGLSNLRGRLALLYPDRHELRIESADKLFKVRLTVEGERE